MTVVVDSSVLIDHLRDDDRATELLLSAEVADRRMVCSVMSKIELTVGALERQDPALRALFDLVDWFPVTEEVADLGSDYARRWGRAYSGIDPVDYVIAATTTLLGAELWTHKVRHFPMFEDLEAPY